MERTAKLDTNQKLTKMGLDKD
jgi:GTPase